ncbi:putative glycosidase [Helianthus annuus]|uniref:Glycosidase n=3 Tax=Helianthus annuus TaxID=4232 RepID=A0A251SRS3_HELAN|nr:heparanase-like protein 3 isoform X1 [Helianthus annuus]KAF5773431.1 putative glycosidase [Helianthus annuus]KAJ0476921.1 putative glycosidase [Helianthus annuus]KAJ0481269.1 putative glycosidase [Helianthus annuus]KAJ0497745.1 putative glycosidase [Helianthus annuus]KAJ0663752.1 putative glycosidase [Helianthus annuus]
MASNPTNRPKRRVIVEIGLLVGTTGLCLVLVMVLIPGLKKLLLQKVGFGEGMVHVNGTSSIGLIDEDFICATLDWWPPQKCDYGTCSWGSSSILNLDLNVPVLLNAIRAFSPLKLRLGGTLQNRVIYQRQGGQEPCSQFTKTNDGLMGYTQGCLPLSRWDELNTFFQNSRAKVIFGLNALYQREVKTNGAVIGPWNSSDAEALMKYTVDKGFTIHGWELGNELSGRGIGASIGADQYASDMVSLQNLVQKIYKAFEVKPLVLGPGGFFDANWFNEFVNKSKDSLQVITQHIYNLGPGVDNHLVEKILNPSYLDGGSQPFRDVQNILKKSKASTVAWVGEAGGAYNSGHNHVTNSFVFSFWYLDQLGMAASYDTKTYCRQTLIGGNYGLLNTDTYVPNPDYYSALLWHRLMGRRVLSTSFQGTRMIRSYAHCSKRSNGMTILLINLDGITKTEVGVTIENETIAVASKRQIKQTHSSKLRNKEFTREEYHLTAKDGNLNSHTVLLNGKELTVNSTGIIPSLDPVEANLRDPITVAPYSIVFVHIPGIHIQACT